MQYPRIVASAGESLLPQLAGISAEYAKEEENEKALKGVEDGKKDLEGKGSPSNGKCSE